MRVETIAQKLGRDFAAVARRRSLCEDSGNDFGDDGRAEYERAGDAVMAHDAARKSRYRFGRLRVLDRWARMRGFRPQFVGGVCAPLQAGGTGAIVVEFGRNDYDKWYTVFAREISGTTNKHIFGAVLATREEAVRFVAAALGVLS